jgi:4-hydroxybenzoyl-CoA reductase subunit beta
MQIPGFTLHRPRSLAAVHELTRTLPSFDFLGGGTDLLCNYKNQLNCRPHVISLTHLDELRGISATRIGAAVRLVEVEESAELAAALPVLRTTVAQIATPLIRQTATVGGNLLVDTRCYWFNQTREFRIALGSCLKAESNECRVVPNPTVCYATYSGDLGPVLMALQARIQLVGLAGPRVVAAQDFFVPPLASAAVDTGGGHGGDGHRMPDSHLLDGIGRNTKRPDELIVAVEFPPQSQRLRAGYMKLRARDSMDFPDAGLAMALERDGAGRLTRLHLVAGAVAPTPLPLDALGASLLGTVPDDAAIEALAERVVDTVVPHKNTHFTPKYRRKMLGVFTRRLMRQLLG